MQSLLAELQSYDEEVCRLEEELRKIPADFEAQKLLANLEEVQSRIATLLTQVEQGRATLEGARGQQEQRGHDILTYKKFLDETDSWLKNIVASMKQEQPIATSKVRSCQTKHYFQSSWEQIDETSHRRTLFVLGTTSKFSGLGLVGTFEKSTCHC